jgi:DNA-binding NarL/FixJ family response regulator
MSAIAPKAPKSILMIDDDDLIAGSLRQVLQADGCDVDVALDPRAAVASMHAKGYDVVIVDPYLTGAIHDDAGLLGSIETLQPRAFTPTRRPRWPSPRRVSSPRWSSPNPNPSSR